MRKKLTLLMVLAFLFGGWANAQSTEADIKSFSLPGQEGETVINAEDTTIAINFLFGADVTNLAATFTYSEFATVQVGGIPQISTVTTNDFSDTVVYKVTAQDGITFKDWKVIVSILPASKEADILTFSLPGQVGETVINGEDTTVLINFPYGTDTADLDTLIATFTLSTHATAKVDTVVQVNNVTANDFSDFENPVVYKVTAQDTTISKEWKIIVSILPAETGADITSFSLPGQVGETVINGEDTTVLINFPYGTDTTDLSDLVAKFEISKYAKAEVNGTLQASDVTHNDFSDFENPVVYKVTAQDGLTIKNWKIIVSILPAETGADITSFTLPGQEGVTVINGEDTTVLINFPYGTDTTSLSDLVAKFELSKYAKAEVNGASQTSDVTHNDFSDFENPVVYKVTAQDTTISKEWKIIVSILPAETGADITSFTLPGQEGVTVINGEDTTVLINFPYGTDTTDLSDLVAKFELSKYAKAEVNGASQTSDVTQNDFSDFENPVVYKVTAQDTTISKEWKIILSILPINTEAEIVEFTLPGQVGETVINSDDSTVLINFPHYTDLADLDTLIATFTLSPHATAKVDTVEQVSGVTENDFTNPVIYTVMAQDSTTKDWKVIVSILPAPNTDAEILTFTLNGVEGFVNSANKTVTISLPYGTNVTNLVATFTLSEGATAKVDTVEQESGVTANNFSSPVVYKVTAEDGTTTKDWTVIVTLPAPNTAAEITAFSFAEQYSPAEFDNVNNKINIVVNEGTSLTNLVATFTLSEGATAKVGATTQVSGVTANDFSNYVVYKVTAEDGSTYKNWTVKVSVHDGIETLENSAITIYPNPNKGNFSLDFNNINGKVSYQIIDTKGSVIVSNNSFVDGNAMIEVSLDLASGVYFVKVITETQSLIEKLVIE